MYRSNRRGRKKKRIGDWSAEKSPEFLARRAKYVGSPEHKAHPSPAGPPRLRKTATPCSPDVGYQQIQRVLRTAVRRKCVGVAIDQGFPRYVWGWLDGELYEAKLVNAPEGSYKAYRLDESEYPEDPGNMLYWGTE